MAEECLGLYLCVPRPYCVSVHRWSYKSCSDIKKQVHELATSVYQIRGHIKGKTLLPFPQGAKHIDEEERKAKASSGKECNIRLKNAIEGIIIKWAYQVDEVLSKDSSEEIAHDKNPGPMSEINFWEAKCINLESLFEQVRL